MDHINLFFIILYSLYIIINFCFNIYIIFFFLVDSSSYTEIWFNST